MKICVPTMTADGKAAEVHDHFGSAPFFTVYDTEGDTIEVIANDNAHHQHGTCLPTNILSECKIDAVLCRGMGLRAVNKLNEANVRVYKADGAAVSDVIAAFKEHRLQQLTADNACDQHKCH